MPYFVHCSRDTLPRPLLQMPEGVSTPWLAPSVCWGPFYLRDEREKSAPYDARSLNNSNPNQSVQTGMVA